MACRAVAGPITGEDPGDAIEIGVTRPAPFNLQNDDVATFGVGRDPLYALNPLKDPRLDLFSSGEASAWLGAMPPASPTAAARIATLPEDQSAAGPTLRQALRSIVSPAASRGLSGEGMNPDPGRVPQTDSARVDLDALLGFNPSQMLLDNKFLGGALAAIIAPNGAIENAKTFSIFGQGQFLIAPARDTRSVDFVELSSGTVLPILTAPAPLNGIPPAREGLDASRTATQAQGGDTSAYLFLIEHLSEFLASPIGMLSAILAGLFGVIGLSRKLVAILQRPTPNARGR